MPSKPVLYFLLMLTLFFSKTENEIYPENLAKHETDHRNGKMQTFQSCDEMFQIWGKHKDTETKATTQEAPKNQVNIFQHVVIPSIPTSQHNHMIIEIIGILTQEDITDGNGVVTS